MTRQWAAKTWFARNSKAGSVDVEAPGTRLYSNGLPALAFLVLLAVGAIISQSLGSPEPSPQAARVKAQTFSICGTARRQNCVVDGDTFWLNGEKIRIADIDTPELSPPRCAHERQLGLEAKHALQRLLNDGAFELAATGSRDADRYGRKLRVVLRGGHSIGDQLIAEGLARPWTGARRSWCDHEDGDRHATYTKMFQALS